MGKNFGTETFMRHAGALSRNLCRRSIGQIAHYLPRTTESESSNQSSVSTTR